MQLKLKQHLHRTICKLATRFDVFNGGFARAPSAMMLEGTICKHTAKSNATDIDE